MSNALLDAALAYAAQGIPVFPCKARDKTPLTAHGFKDASKDPKQIKAWWKHTPQANIGIPTGAASGWVVIDVDPRNGGGPTWTSLLVSAGEVLEPETRVSNTGGGGTHYVFTYPGTLKLAKTLGKGIDIQGDGKYIIAPPSVHPSGTTYEWDTPEEPVIEMPAWLLKWCVAPEHQAVIAGAPPAASDPLSVICPECQAARGAKCENYQGKGCAPHSQRKIKATLSSTAQAHKEPSRDAGKNKTVPSTAPKASTAVARSAEVDRRLRRARAYLAKVPPAIAGHQGHAQTWQAALAVTRGFDLDVDTAFELLAEDYNPRCEPPWSEKELRHKVHSAAKDAKVSVGYLLEDKAAKPFVSWQAGQLVASPPRPSEPSQPGLPDTSSSPAADASRPVAGDVSSPSTRDTTPPAPPAPPPAPPPPVIIERASGVELSRLLLHRLQGDGEPLVYTDRSFYRYDPAAGIWRGLPQHQIEHLVHGFDGLPYAERGVEKRLNLWQPQILHIINSAKARVTREEFFGHLPGIVCENGFVTADREGVFLKPHSSSHRARFSLPFAYSPEARSERWQWFLAEMFKGEPDAEDKIKLMAEFVGAALIGLATRFAKALLLLGIGSNGKSVFIDVVKALFAASANTSIPPQQMDDEYRRAMLATSQFNSVSELPETDIIDSTAFKGIASGDVTTARHIREAPFQFVPVAAHLYGANGLPTSSDQSWGFFRRFMILRLRRQFNDAEADKNLRFDIIATELQGVATWALEGAVRLLAQNAYTVPESSRVEMAAWRRSCDQVQQFVDDSLERKEEPILGGGVLFDEYRKWATQNAHKHMNSNKFAARMEALGFARTRLAAGSFWNVDIRKPTA